MAQVEIDEATADMYQRGMALLKKLTDDPKARPEFEKALKAVNPEYVTEAERAAALAQPHIDGIKSELEQQIKPIAEEFAAMKAAREDEAKRSAERTLNDQMESLKKQGFTDERIESIKKLMQDRTIPDVDAAVALHDKLNPPPPVAPASLTPDGWHYDSDLAVGGDGPSANAKDWFENEDKAADLEAVKVLNDMRREAA